MSIPLHPLTKPHVDPYSGLPEAPGAPPEMEIERRAQELLNEWLGFYFSGNAVASPVAGGSTADRTLMDCEILFDHATPSNPSTKPVLHTILTDRRDDGGVPAPGDLICHTGEWTYNTLVRVFPQMPADAADDGPQATDARRAASQACRRVADQCAWLLRGPHTQSLAFKGLNHVRVLNGPRLIQSGNWFMRQIVWSVKVRFHTVSNSP